MRIKIFERRTTEEMQREIDEWTDRNPRCKILSVTACDSHSDGICRRLAYIIFEEWPRG